MCGIAGLLDVNNAKPAAQLEMIAGHMADALTHRGPDDRGVWSDDAAGIALGHRRLSILDLSPSGRQPMHSACGRWVISYNGEVYNYKSLRSELQGRGHSFVGGSDTEVILAAFSEWGVATAVPRFDGMFAFAAWDRVDRRLYLGRDRVGEKPLYYGILSSGALVFASELKAIHAHPDFVPSINRDALTLYLRHGYVPAPYCIFERLSKLPPASVLIAASDGRGSLRLSGPSSYWSMRAVAEAGAATQGALSDPEASEHLEGLLRQAVRSRMVADVPLGAFLSGGIDSSLVVALMQAQSDRPVKTFTVGFREVAYNEAVAAKAVARHLGTDHCELYVSAAEAQATVPLLANLYDEPFADQSQIPTYLVAQLARRYVTVSLSGDAGDELFGGYNRYFWGRRLWRGIGWVPRSIRGGVGKVLREASPSTLNVMDHVSRILLPPGWRVSAPTDKLRKLGTILDARHPQAMYATLISNWADPESIVIGGREPTTSLNDSRMGVSLSDFTMQMMYLDLVGYLPDDILVKVDRASMGASLEARVPLLDHRVIEFAWRLPIDLKVRNGRGKWLLRQVVEKYVPRELIDRPKMGFGVPMGAWLRGPLREWANSLIEPRLLRAQGYFEAEPIRRCWQEHLSARHDWNAHLWPVLMFQAWLNVWGHRAEQR